MKQEFIDAINASAETLKTRLLIQANIDWAESYSRMDLTPVQAKELADNYVRSFMLQELYLQSSKMLVK